MKLNIIMPGMRDFIKPTDRFKDVIIGKIQTIEALKNLCMEQGIDGDDYRKLLNTQLKNGPFFADLSKDDVFEEAIMTRGPCVLMDVDCRAIADPKNPHKTLVGFPYYKPYATLVRLPVDGNDRWFRKTLKAGTSMLPTSHAEVKSFILTRTHNFQENAQMLKAGKIDPDEHFEMDEFFISGWLVFA